MKRLLFILNISLVLTIFACSNRSEAEGLPASVNTPLPREIVFTPLAETSVPAVQSAKSVPYIERIADPDQRIYSGPGYDYGYVTAVKEAGAYTMLEEAWDEEGNLWGRLKSGLGWVDLSDIRSGEEVPPVRINYSADVDPATGTVYGIRPGGIDEYAIPVTVLAEEHLVSARLSLLEMTETGYAIAADLCELREMEKGDALSAELSFPGDLSAYAFSCETDEGTVYSCLLSISLRNGELSVLPIEIDG